MIGCGLAGRARRPASQSGPPLAAAGFAWFVPDFAATGADPLGWLGAQAVPAPWPAGPAGADLSAGAGPGPG